MASKQRRDDAPEGDTQVLSDDPHVLREELSTLESQLQEKEQLVAALTNRLEQAAEQLDRLHRTGGDRGVRISGIPPELLEQQKNLADELQRAVQSWDDMQCGPTLGRIEVQITELRDLVAQRLANAQIIEGSPSGMRSSASQSSSAPRETSKDGASNWEAMKASLMGEAAPDVPAPSHAAPADEAGSEGPLSFETAEDDIPLGEAPQPVDLANATIEELRKAVDVRDAYIATMARKLRVVGSRRVVMPNWESVNNAPDDLRTALQELERRLDEALRLAEVELSLERARLGREGMRLRMLEEQLEKESKRRGALGIEEGKKLKTANDDPEHVKSQRWLRMLGMGKDGEQ